MKLEKLASKSIVLSLTMVTLLTPIVSTVSAMEPEMYTDSQIEHLNI